MIVYIHKNYDLLPTDHAKCRSLEIRENFQSGAVTLVPDIAVSKRRGKGPIVRTSPFSEQKFSSVIFVYMPWKCLIIIVPSCIVTPYST